MSTGSYEAPTGETFIHWGEVCYRTKWSIRGRERLSLPGNIIFLIVFAILLQPQIFLAIKHHTVGTGIFLILGVTTEILGYVGRVLMSLDPGSWTFNMIGHSLTILAPLFVAAGIYHSLSRIVAVFDGNNVESKAARWKPRTYTFLLLGFTVVTLVLQSVGLVFWTSKWPKETQLYAGFHLLFASIVVHVTSLVFFIITCSELAFKWRTRSRQGTLNKQHASIYQSKKFKYSIFALISATLCIFIRSVFQLVRESFWMTTYNPIYNNEAAFLCLDGAMMAIACIALTVAHPGFGFGAVWKEGGVRFGRKKSEVETSEVETDVDKSVPTSFESVRKDEATDGVAKQT